MVTMVAKCAVLLLAPAVLSLEIRTMDRLSDHLGVQSVSSLNLEQVEFGLMSAEEFGRRWSDRFHAEMPNQYPYTIANLDDDPPVLLQAEDMAPAGIAPLRKLEHHAKELESGELGHSHNFTREFALSMANSKKQLIVTFVNDHYVDFAANWVTHLRALNVTNYIVGAMDPAAHSKLSALNIPTFNMDSGLTQGDYGWGSHNFRIMGQHKFQFLLNLMRFGIDTFMTDADTVLLRDPFQFIAKYPDVDVLVSSDHLAYTVDGEELEWTGAAHSAMNIGLMYLKHTAEPLVKDLQDAIMKSAQVWDQDKFNSLMRQGWKVDGDKHTFEGYNRKLTGGILPISIFASGHTGFVQNTAGHLGLQPYAYHATFQYGGTVGKRHRMREFMLFNDAKEYFDPPQQNFITYDPEIPEHLKTPAVKGSWTVDEHFALANYQLIRLRKALVAAKTLNRILIMPVLVCGMDRWWAPHHGTIPGAKTTLPVDPCPADHMIQLDHLMAHQEIREWSFLANPRTPADVKESVKTLNLHHSGKELHAAAHETSRVLKLVDMPDYFDEGVLTGAEDQKQFEHDMIHDSDIWCCVHPPGGRGAGHIWYNFLFDRPHQDRFGNKWTKDHLWKPKLGP